MPVSWLTTCRARHLLSPAEGRLDPLIGRHDVLERTLQASPSFSVAFGPPAVHHAPPHRLTMHRRVEHRHTSPGASHSLLQVLLRRTKNNPVLIGDPGVGKTAVAEGLAQLIASPSAPPGLAGRALISLDVGSLVAGTQYRGAFEERLTVGACCARRQGPCTLGMGNASWRRTCCEVSLSCSAVWRPSRRLPGCPLSSFPTPLAHAAPGLPPPATPAVSRCSTRCVWRRGACCSSLMSCTY